MSQLIELPDPIYDALEEAAADSGITPAKWIAEQLRRASAPACSPPIAEAAEYAVSNGDDVLWREPPAPPRPR